MPKSDKNDLLLCRVDEARGEVDPTPVWFSELPSLRDTASLPAGPPGVLGPSGELSLVGDQRQTVRFPTARSC